MSATIHGRCLCGAIELELTPPTEPGAHCHCESCRRAHAAPLVTWTAVPAGKLRITRGEANLERYQSSPGTYRCFCRTCGTSMICYYNAEHQTFGASANKRYVPLAVLSEPLDQPPMSHVSFDERVSWLDITDELPRYRGKSDERLD